MIPPRLQACVNWKIACYLTTSIAATHFFNLSLFHQSTWRDTLCQEHCVHNDDDIAGGQIFCNPNTPFLLRESLIFNVQLTIYLNWVKFWTFLNLKSLGPQKSEINICGLTTRKMSQKKLNFFQKTDAW